MQRKLLVAYSMTSTHVKTTLDYLRELKKYLGYDTTYLHVTHDAIIDIDLAAAGYDIVFHNYCSRFCFEGYVSRSYREKLRRFPGLKVMAVQDEYDFTNELKDAIKDCGFHIVLTCVPQEALEYVYPSREFPDVEFISVFTGYVPDIPEHYSTTMPLAERPIVVGYRGRDIGPRYGRVAFEKFEIGRRMKDICDERGIVNDIAMDEASRIYGAAWLDFIGRCRAMLGSESGSNVFDFDGAVAAELARMKAAFGRAPTYDEFLPVVAGRDREIDMRQIAPRVFECAIMRTPMILFRGRYSGVIEPNLHYIPLDLDFSNANEVLRRLEDIPALEALADRAYQHLVSSGRFNYRAFCEMLRERFESRLTKLARPVRLDGSITTFTARAHGPRRQLLVQIPTDEPKGMADYGLVQVRMTVIQSLEQLAQMDDFYSKVMADCLSVVDKLQTYHDKLSSRTLESSPRSEAANGLAEAAHCAENLRQSHRLIALEGERFGADRTAIERTIADFLAEGRSEDARYSLEQLAALAAKRIVSYAAAYEAFYAQYLREYDQLQRSIATLMSQLGPRTRFIHALSHPRRSILDLAKSVVRRVPGGLSMALALRSRPPMSTLDLVKSVVRRVPGGLPLALAIRRFGNWILKIGLPPRN